MDLSKPMRTRAQLRWAGLVLIVIAAIHVGFHVGAFAQALWVFSIPPALWIVMAVSAASGLAVLVWMMKGMFGLKAEEGESFDELDS